MDRRAFLAASAATATMAGAKTATADTLPLGPLPDMRYPDVRIEAADKKFFGTHFPAFAGTAEFERVATGFRWAEGPAFFREGNYLIFSDIPNNRMMRLLWDDNHLSVFREPSNNSNGNTLDPQGRLVTCEHRARRVTRTELDGTITVIADKYNGKRLNSPNDVVVASNGSIWFTDPTYGIGGNYEGLKQAQEQDKHYVFRVDGKTGEIKPVVDDFTQPNGIFLDRTKRGSTSSTAASPMAVPRISGCSTVDIETGNLTNGKVFAEGFAPGITDGMRCDIDGNVWCSMGWADPKEDGVRCYSPSGDLLGKIHLPETCANLCFGGPLRNRLFVCGSTSVYALYVGTQGALNRNRSARRLGSDVAGLRFFRAIGAGQGATALRRHTAIVDTLSVGGFVREALFEGPCLLRDCRRRRHDQGEAQSQCFPHRLQRLSKGQIDTAIADQPIFPSASGAMPR